MSVQSAAGQQPASQHPATQPLEGTRWSVVIVGAGPAGIRMSVELLRRGIDDIVVLEKADAAGGTWRDNRYPGVACDVPAHYYSYPFAPNVTARTTFATGAELQDYFTGIARDFCVEEHIRFGAEVATARWNGRCWQLETVAGDRLSADVVVTGVGRLHRPRCPDIPGLADFDGLIRHSAQWDPATDLAGVRLGVIGTGSSATQITVAAAPQVTHLDLFQRTPQWVLPVVNDVVPDELRRELSTDPEAARRNYAAVEQQIATGADAVVTGDPQAIARRNGAIRAALAGVVDPELRAKLTPDYEIGCKRLVVSAGFYDAVQRMNVALVTEPIERIEAAGVRTRDGVLHELDVIILATGFHADAFLRPMTVTGQDGIDLDAIWADAFVNYKSVAIPHMPNFFTVNGPFSPGGSLSILTVIENHVTWIAGMVAAALDGHMAIVAEPDRTAELFAQVRERAKQTVWYVGGCQSWYLDRDGVPIVSPLTLEQLRADLREPVWSDFTVTPLPAEETTPAEVVR